MICGILLSVLTLTPGLVTPSGTCSLGAFCGPFLGTSTSPQFRDCCLSAHSEKPNGKRNSGPVSQQASQSKPNSKSPSKLPSKENRCKSYITKHCKISIFHTDLTFLSIFVFIVCFVLVFVLFLCVVIYGWNMGQFESEQVSKVLQKNEH